MQVKKCKWKYGKQAPFMLMVDDLANKYLNDRDNGSYLGADWGGRCKQKNSFYDLICKELLDKFPYLKITLFLVVGKRMEIIEKGKKNRSFPIDNDKGFRDFLKELAYDERFEIAYHGYNHGKIERGKFVQEWCTFRSCEEAVRQINAAKQKYREVTGKNFFGGKYCGYEKNEFSDESIVNTEFTWWCRNWCGNFFLEDKRENSSLDIKKFGNVIDIPSTLDGSLYSLKNIRCCLKRGYRKAVYYKLKYKITVENIIDFLVKENKVISLQEHTSPYREDNKKQYPNIVDDIYSIQYILSYLKKYNIWYATGHEIEEYCRLYEETIVNNNKDGFEVYTNNKKLNGQKIWIEINETSKTTKAFFESKKCSVLEIKDSILVEIPVYLEKVEYKIYSK